MSKTKVRDPDMSEEYNFSAAKRGVYSTRAGKGARVVHVTDAQDKARQASKNLNKSAQAKHAS